MKVVVTGVAGFIGSQLAERLVADGHEVVGLDCFTDYYPRAAKERNLARLRDSAGFQLVEQRLQDADLKALLDGAAHVYHLAAQAGVRASWGREFAALHRAQRARDAAPARGRALARRPAEARLRLVLVRLRRLPVRCRCARTGPASRSRPTG